MLVFVNVVDGIDVDVAVVVATVVFTASTKSNSLGRVYTPYVS